VPWHRAQRQTVMAARGVPLSAAALTSATLDAAATDEAKPPSETLILPAFQRRLLQVASPAGPAADDGAGRMAGAMRRLMVTPWFAAATGFVVAAGLWIYSPHAELKLPAVSNGGVPCRAGDCAIAGANGNAATNGAGGQAVTPSVKSAGKLAAGSVGRRLKFGYRVLWQGQGRFGLLISVSGRRVPRSWHMAFALPGDTISAVEGATWSAWSSDGGLVSWPAANAWQLAGPQDNGYQHDATTSVGPGDSFVVVGSGAQLVPTSCSFNGKTCKFS
jgi:hypothetical protein